MQSTEKLTLHTSRSVVIESRNYITAHEVLHVALHREAKVIRQINVRAISNNRRILKSHRKLIKYAARQNVSFVVTGDTL